MFLRSLLLLFGVGFFLNGALAQNDQLPQRTALFEYRMSFQQDSISYLLSSGGRDSDPRKLVLFLQGSQPFPLFIEQPNGAYAATFPADYYPYWEDYYFCILPKPAIPIVAKQEELTPDGLYLDPATKQLSQAYQDRNYLEYYVERATAVLEQLAKTRELDDIIVIGGSEGARVGTSLARNCPLVTHFVYYSADPLGRFYQLLSAERRAWRKGEKTGEEVEASIEALYAEWREMNADPLSVETTTGDTNRAWVSFSTSVVDELLQLEIPVLVAHGTADDSITNMDYLRLEAIRQQRENVEFRVYVDHDHQLNKLVRNAEGKVVSREYVFDQIYREWLQWAEKH